MGLIESFKYLLGTTCDRFLIAAVLLFGSAAANPQAVHRSSFPNATNRDFGTYEVEAQ